MGDVFTPPLLASYELNTRQDGKYCKTDHIGDPVCR